MTTHGYVDEGHPRENTYWQVDALIAYLLRTPSLEELKRIRRQAYAEFDRGHA